MSTTQESGSQTDDYPKVAIVTGAAQGIGRAIALRLAQDGFDVAVNDIEQNKDALSALVQEIRDTTKQKSTGIHADVSNEEDVNRLVETVVQEFGNLGVMVANAGIAPVQSILDVTVDTWDRTFAVNARGVMLCYKYAAQVMIKQGRGGRIIGACSIGGKRGAAGVGGYCASKFAIRGLSQSTAVELAPYGINVNTYAPGFIQTSMLDNMADTFAKGLNIEKLDLVQKQLQTVPIGRLGTPEDVSRVVSFLAGKDSQYVTGQSIVVDGGTYFD